MTGPLPINFNPMQPHQPMPASADPTGMMNLGIPQMHQQPHADQTQFSKQNASAPQGDGEPATAKLGYIKRITSFLDPRNLIAGFGSMAKSVFTWSSPDWKNPQDVNANRQRLGLMELLWLPLDVGMTIATHGISIPLYMMWPGLSASGVLKSFFRGVHQAAYERSQAKEAKTA